jgi:hypothetical protein
VLLGVTRLSGFAISIPVAFWSLRATYALWVAGIGLAALVDAARSRIAAR